MGVSARNHYWTSRTNLADPTSPNGAANEAWALNSGSGSGGSANNDNWRVTNQIWKVAKGDSNTLLASFKIVAKPDTSEMVMAIDNGTHRAEVQITSSLDSISLVGSSTATKSDLDLDVSEYASVPVLLRLTLDSSGNARLYIDEIIEDDDANTHYLSVTASSSTSEGVYWGNTTGTLDWSIVFHTSQGAYSPDELDASDFINFAFIRTALKIIEVLKDSKRFYLKNHVTDSSIIYGYDLSTNMVSRLNPPTVHVVTTTATSPEFNTLSGARTDQDYSIDVYVTTRGTDYRNAYRLGLSIMGEVFDELYTNTGLDSGIDSLIGYNLIFDTKMDDDETICVHQLNLTYMKKVNMTRREV
tara:strand:+ start:357 stop:1430 length:1074 start_codon:yes stop_codon:yes gene_type:complete